MIFHVFLLIHPSERVLLLLSASLRVGDGDLDLHSGLDGDGGDLLDNLARRVQVDDALMDTHLEPVPRLGPLSAGRLAGGDAKGAGRHADGALGLEVLVLGALDEVVANLLQGLDVARGQGDADAVDGGLLSGRFLLVVGLGKGEQKGHEQRIHSH